MRISAFFLIPLLIISSNATMTISPPITQQASGTTSITLPAWTISSAASSSVTCTLSSYNGEFYFSTFSTTTKQDNYVTGTYYRKVQLTGTQTALNAAFLSLTYRVRTYYISTSDSISPTPTYTDYIEMVCNDGTSTANSVTYVGINSGWVPFCTTNVCNSHGNCNPTTGACTCYYPYSGSTCSTIDCGNCHNGGTCNTATGTCTCPSSTYGSHCQYLYCPLGATATNCNNNGWCDINTGICNCYSGFLGYDCSKIECLNGCNQGGVCNYATGTCTCYTNYYGTDCSYVRCPRDCGAYGGCDHTTGECKCFGTYTQEDCMFETCPGTPICNGNGVCNYYSGACVCNSGYIGVDCSQAQ